MLYVDPESFVGLMYAFMLDVYSNEHWNWADV